MKRAFLAATFCAAIVWILAAPGCATRGEGVTPDSLTRDVGVYPPPPAGLQRARAGVPPFTIVGEGAEGKLNLLAADQLTSLIGLTRRFKVIERAQLNQLLNEQNLEGIVRSDEMAKRAQVRGVDYLIYGTVSNLRIRQDKSSTGFGLAQVPIIGVGGFDYKNKDSRVVSECGVDLRMVDPSTGEVAAQHFGEFKRTDSIGAFGVAVLGMSSHADADLQISENDKGKILRLALDEAVKKMLPQIDTALLERAREAKAAQPAPKTPAAQPAASTPATPAPKATPQFCPNCGTKLEAGAKFCPKCGKKVTP